MNKEKPAFEKRPEGKGPQASSFPDGRVEAEYLQKLAADQTPVNIHLRTGEEVQGFVEYYDRDFVRLTREGAENLFLFKKEIKYIVEKS